MLGAEGADTDVVKVDAGELCAQFVLTQHLNIGTVRALHFGSCRAVGDLVRATQDQVTLLAVADVCIVAKQALDLAEHPG